MDRLLNSFTSICVYIIANTIQVCKIYQVAFCFTIDTLDDEMIVFLLCL